MSDAQRAVLEHYRKRAWYASSIRIIEALTSMDREGVGAQALFEFAHWTIIVLSRIEDDGAFLKEAIEVLDHFIAAGK